MYKVHFSNLKLYPKLQKKKVTLLIISNYNYRNKVSDTKKTQNILKVLKSLINARCT